MADELGKLDRLRQSGALSDAEFAAAKRSLLEPKAPAREDSIGRAANRYVSFQVVAGVIGLIVFLIFLLAVFLPMADKANDMVPPSLTGFNQGPINFP
ncbi:SHOCT domain-containing protein [Umezawaea endophytica]|uniref:SHOCT domain-containing protein n=1 Tax=Umezawaea endophytica TaxID=1654476 RepID=A0A9X2VKN5_9PSEU|nr:SHOCT domain-containing protein [Umezawaea endophytica]MCS7476918.1 SHOCT domain-containing protein [Umezawaea endophytica]